MGSKTWAGSYHPGPCRLCSKEYILSKFNGKPLRNSKPRSRFSQFAFHYHSCFVERVSEEDEGASVEAREEVDVEVQVRGDDGVDLDVAREMERVGQI